MNEPEKTSWRRFFLIMDMECDPEKMLDNSKKIG
jgi:hypothetical protein